MSDRMPSSFGEMSWDIKDSDTDSGDSTDFQMHIARTSQQINIKPNYSEEDRRKRLMYVSLRKPTGNKVHRMEEKRRRQRRKFYERPGHGIPHTWFDNQTLLRLMDPTHLGNYVVFQQAWNNQEPVIVSDTMRKYNNSLWTPDFFSQKFGEIKTDFVDILTGERIFDQPMKIFWAGFEDLTKRPKNESGDPMLLKMKEWPPCASFKSILPNHMNNLFDALPLPAYTHPGGLLNFFEYIPIGYLSQDLGIEITCAYGTTSHTTKGTKNLTTCVSDGLHMLAYVGNAVTEENKYDFHEEYQEILQNIEESGCDYKSLERVTIQGDIPGAIWHVYHVKDMDKINEFLDEVQKERGMPQATPKCLIQSGTWYLDEILRNRLKVEKNIECHAILHCLGDSIIIPAGAPYQVRNLKSCITVKHDFVSSTNVASI